MKEKIIYLFTAFCLIVNVFLIGTMINDKVEAEEINTYQVEETTLDDDNASEQESNDEETIPSYNPDNIIYSSKTYKENDFKEYYKNDGYIVTEKSYPLNKEFNNIAHKLTLLDYSLVNIANGYGEQAKENILHGLSSYYLTVNFELENLSEKEYKGSFYDFILRFIGGYDGEYVYGKNEMSFVGSGIIYKDYILSPTYFNDIYVFGEDYIIGAGETLKGQLIYNLGYGNYDGCGFDLIRLYGLENKITNKVKVVKGVAELVKRDNKITMDYMPAGARKAKEEVIVKEEAPEPIIEDKYYKIGDTVKGNKASFKIIDTKELEDEEGSKYMIINVQFTNISKESQSINFDDFGLRDGNGAYKSNVTYYDKLGIKGLSGEVGSGTTITGNIIYDITSYAVAWGDSNNKGKYEIRCYSNPNCIVEF